MSLLFTYDRLFISTLLPVGISPYKGKTLRVKTVANNYHFPILYQTIFILSHQLITPQNFGRLLKYHSTKK